MLQELVIEDIPDELFARLVECALSEGRTVEDMVRDWLIATARQEEALQADLKRKSDSED